MWRVARVLTPFLVSGPPLASFLCSKTIAFAMKPALIGTLTPSPGWGRLIKMLLLLVSHVSLDRAPTPVQYPRSKRRSGTDVRSNMMLSIQMRNLILPLHTQRMPFHIVWLASKHLRVVYCYFWVEDFFSEFFVFGNICIQRLEELTQRNFSGGEIENVHHLGNSVMNIGSVEQVCLNIIRGSHCWWRFGTVERPNEY